MRPFDFDTPDQYTLPKMLSIPNVSGRVGYDDNKTMGFMKFMLKTGLWTLTRRPMFDNLRRSMLYNLGPGSAHEIRMNIVGQETPNVSVDHHIAISEPLGQTHMAAAGAVLQVERVFGLHALARPVAGISHPAAASDAAPGVQRLRQMGGMCGDLCSLPPNSGIRWACTAYPRNERPAAFADIAAVHGKRGRRQNRPILALGLPTATSYPHSSLPTA